MRLLKRDGSGTITTNRIAKVAGVSIGSAYQYFPDRRAIFIALHERHINEIDRMIQTKLVEHAAAYACGNTGVNSLALAAFPNASICGAAPSWLGRELL